MDAHTFTKPLSFQYLELSGGGWGQTAHKLLKLIHASSICSWSATAPKLDNNSNLDEIVRWRQQASQLV